MMKRIRPLELELEFEDGTYKLGDTINVTVGLTPKSDVDVRGGRVDLLCEEHYIQTGVTFIPDTYSPSAGVGGISGSTGHVAKEQKERFVHSSAPYLEATRLRAGAPRSYVARLQIQRTQPPHAEEARDLARDASSAWSFRWTLVATVDVVRGRDVRRQRAVKVDIG